MSQDVSWSKKIGAGPLIATVLILLLIGVTTWYSQREPPRDAWDKKIAELCKSDGGVKIFEKVELTSQQAEELRRGGKHIAVPPKELAREKDPVYDVAQYTHLSPGNPEVFRGQRDVIRRSDQKVVARWVYYERIGGDAPSPGHMSHFECPALNLIDSELGHLFVVDGVQQ